MSHAEPRYRLLTSLGRGGMGEVFLADDTQLGRKVAIKFLTEALEADATARERLHREARSAAALDHPYICKIYEIASVDGRTGIVMEHVSGETVEARLRRAPLAAREALRIAAEIGEALEEAHSRRVVHRDLKPSNVMLTEQGHVKVMDFGLAKRAPSTSDSGVDGETVGPITEVGVRIGTPGYMAPEQLLGGEADERSDIFAFGILLYELLAGVHPFTRTSASGTMSAIVREAPSPIGQYAQDAPLSASVTIERLLAKDPRERYQSFREVRTDLERLVQDTSGLTPARPATRQGARDAGLDTGAVVARQATEPPAHRTPLIGRETEAAELRSLLGRTAAGTGALVSLAGEPGVGKTRLSSELMHHARGEGFLTLVGHCYEGEGARPFLPWVEILETTARIAPKDTLRTLLGDGGPEIAKLLPALRRLFPDLPPPLELDPESERHHLFACFGEYVERSSRLQPLLLVLEDLHWADEPTLLLLRHVTQRLAEMPVLVLATYRDVELDVDRPLAAALRQLVKDRLVTRVVLRRLRETDVNAMVAALSEREPPRELVTTIYHETEGNPFFVEEVYEHLAEEGRLFDADGAWRTDLTLDALDVPEGVRLVVGRRLERLSDEHRRVLTVAAVLGRRFPYPLLEAATDLDPDALLDGIEAAERLHLVEADTETASREPRYRFAHELIRQTLLVGLSMPRRQRLHARVAAAIEERHAGNLEKQAPMLAHHLYEAGARVDEEKTVRVLTLAGGQALEAGGFEEALRSFEMALSLEPAERDVQAGLLWHRGLARRSLGAWDRAIDDWNQALPIFEKLDDTRAVARTCQELAFLHIWIAQPTEAVAAARRGLQALDPEASAERCRMLGHCGWALSMACDFETADEMVRESVAMADELADAGLRGEAYLLISWHHYHCMHRSEQMESSQKAVELLRPTQDLGKLGDALANLQWSSVCVGRPDTVGRTEAEARELGTRLGRLDIQVHAMASEVQRDWLATADLDLHEANLQRLEALLTAAGGAWTFIGEAWQAQTYLWRNLPQEARDRAEDAVGHEPQANVMTGHGWAQLFLCECFLGHTETALTLLGGRQAELPRAGTFNGIGAWQALFKVVEGLTVIGELQRAAGFYPLTLEAIATGTLTTFDPSHLIETIAGIAAAAGHDWTNAERHYETALRQAHEIPFISEQPEARRWYAQMLIDRDAAGDRDKARTLLGEAVEMYRAIGMPRHLETADKMLAAL